MMHGQLNVKFKFISFNINTLQCLYSYSPNSVKFSKNILENNSYMSLKQKRMKVVQQNVSVYRTDFSLKLSVGSGTVTCKVDRKIW